ncbi:MAG: energy transducer TonB [Marinobacter sp.]
MREAPLAPGKRLWLGALIGAALLHIALAALVFWSPSATPHGQAQAAGTGGVEIALGPAGSTAGGPKNQPGETAPEPPVEPAPEPTPEPTPEPKPEPKPEPIAEKKPPPPPVTKPDPIKKSLTEPRPEARPEPIPAVEEDPLPPKASVAGTTGKSGSKDQNNTGSGDNSAGGGLTGATENYAATLLAWLERHKEYPRRAQLRRQQGTVMLFFVIDRQGRVLEHRIEQSSGHTLLDDEVRELIERAQPLPAMPASMDKETLELVVPVQFFLR